MIIKTEVNKMKTKKGSLNDWIIIDGEIKLASEQTNLIETEHGYIRR